VKTTSKMSGEQRRADILKTVRRVFVEKGFHATTTRELADAAGVSEALIFKHFPNKEALYLAIQMSCFKEEGLKVVERLESLEPSTASLVFLVHDLISHVLGGQSDEDERLFFRLILRSLMDEGEFTRLAIQGGPAHFVRKVKACVEAAESAGDIVAEPVKAKLGAWFVHQLVSGIMLHSLPAEPVIDYEVSREELVNQATWFCLRGIGLKEEAIQRCWGAKDVLHQSRDES
jgi:AcrR family transcriptional regulator